MNTISRHLDPEALYEAHAARLYAYCWALVGDDAPAAVRETFAVAARHEPPRDDVVLWLHALARGVCVRRGALDRAFGGHPARDIDPLRRAAATLRADHREVLVLTGGRWLEPADIGRLLGVGDADTVQKLIKDARVRLERSVLDMLLRHPVPAWSAEPGRAAILAAQEEVIKAFERGRLDVLLAQRAPDRPPAGLRRAAVAAFTAATAHPSAAEEEPLVVIDPAAEPDRRPAGRRRVRGLAQGLVFTVCVATVAGLATVWPGSWENDSNGALDSLSPTATSLRLSLQPTGGTPSGTVGIPTGAVGGTPAGTMGGTPTGTVDGTPTGPAGGTPAGSPGATPPGSAGSTPGPGGTAPATTSAAARPSAGAHARPPKSRAGARDHSAHKRARRKAASDAAAARTRSQGGSAGGAATASQPVSSAEGRRARAPRPPVPSHTSLPSPSPGGGSPSNGSPAGR